MPEIDHPAVTIEDLAGQHFCEVWQAAKILQVDPRTVRTACRLGEIPHIKIGAQYRVSVDWLRTAARPSV